MQGAEPSSARRRRLLSSPPRPHSEPFNAQPSRQALVTGSFTGGIMDPNLLLMTLKEVSAPRPKSTYVRRLTVTKDEKENATEYAFSVGVETSHAKLSSLKLEGIRKPAWLEALYNQKYFQACAIHENSKKNEKNICCLDCCISICPHCVHYHRFHRLLQVRRYVYHDVVRLEDLERLIDCSNVQAYTINSAKVVFIKKRPQNRQFKGSGNYCTSCDRSLQEPFIHCSLGCKVDFVLKHYRDLTPFLRVCTSLQLGPDFIFPNDTGDDDMTNETPHSTIVDSDDPMSSGSGSFGSETMSILCTGFVRKKRSGLYTCERFSSKVHSEEDMATSMSRRKGIPQRSPMC